jgi:hypothetical protein
VLSEAGEHLKKTFEKAETAFKKAETAFKETPETNEMPKDAGEGTKKVIKEIKKPDISFIERTSRTSLMTQCAVKATETKNPKNTERTETKKEKVAQEVVEKDGTNEVNSITDDNGNVFMSEGKLKANTTYELNGNVYTTDEQGRIILCEAKPQLCPENPRDNDAQKQVGGKDRRLGDQGGHIVGRDLNGDGGLGNLVAMDSKINQSDYKRMENDVKNVLASGKTVTTKTEFTYSGESERPDRITVVCSANEKNTIFKFDNNLDGSLMGEVPQNGKETVKAKMEDTGGQISSIKEEYNAKGNLVKTTVNITYTDAEGNNHRAKVFINKPGGENL